MRELAGWRQNQSRETHWEDFAVSRKEIMIVWIKMAVVTRYKVEVDLVYILQVEQTRLLTLRCQVREGGKMRYDF